MLIKRNIAPFLAVLFLFIIFLNQCYDGSIVKPRISNNSEIIIHWDNSENLDLYTQYVLSRENKILSDGKNSLELTKNLIPSQIQRNQLSDFYKIDNAENYEVENLTIRDTLIEMQKSVERKKEKPEKNYFNFSSQLNNSIEQNKIEDIVINLKYPNIFEEMVIVKYENGKVFYPVFEILSFMKLNHSYDILNKCLEGNINNKNKDEFKLDLKNRKLIINENTLELMNTDFIEDDFEIFVTADILKKAFGITSQIDMRSLTAKVQTEYLPPIAERLRNEKRLEIYRHNSTYRSYPLLYDRERKNINGGFLDYSLSASYLKNESPYYSIDAGLGAELLGGDIQVNSQQSFFNKKITYNQVEYKWRYAFLENNYISNISLGHNYSYGLQAYQVKGIHISNEPLEPRKLYGKNQLTGKTNSYYKVEVYQNGQIIDIVNADAEGNYYFDIPFTYGTTLLELHEIGPNGEYKIENKIYHIPIEQIPEGNLEYSFNLGQLSNETEYLLNSNAAYGINDWLTSEIGTDLFLNDYENSSFYSSTTARIYEGNLFNLVVAPNAFNSFSFNSIFPNLANINLKAKYYEQNEKLNPAKIKNEYEGNIFIPFNFNDYQLSFLFRGRNSHYSNTKRSDISLRTFLNYKNISPSLELSYYGLDNNSRLYESTLLNFRLNYSFYLKSAIFSGNIIDARYIYDLMNDRGQAINFTFSTTLLHQLRLQLSYINNFINSNSEIQLRVVLDLPTFRSQTTISRNVLTHSLSGSINYDHGSDSFTYYNRSMLGRSAAKFKFFVDGNSNKMYDYGEVLISNMDVQINSIGKKQKVNESNIIINDLDSYSKYNVKLIDKKNKNPLYFPYEEKFSFISDPHQFKQIEIPFYEAAEASGNIRKKYKGNFLPVSGIKIIFKNLDTNEETEIKSMSDGSYYYYGLKPGHYKIYLNNEQLNRMQLKSNPQIFEVLFKSISKEEDFKEYDFLLE